MANRYANNDEEAEKRYQKYKSKDPFPDIPPALLNSADIQDYVAATGMIYPFDHEKLKSASYGVKLKGSCIYWNEKERKCVKEISDKSEFILEKNSIVYVAIEPTFRLPNYIAQRYNLSISHIHKGLLLGTGPIVDPGFNGKILIPLHNLTDNNYTLRGSDILIWIEFSKISHNTRWFSQENLDRLGEYIEFPTGKNLSNINDYFHKANAGSPIRSSITAIQSIAESAKKRTNIITWSGIAAVVAIVVSLFYPTLQLVEDTTRYIKEVDNRYSKVNKEESKRIETLEKDVQFLKEMFEKQVPSSPSNAEKSALELDESMQDVSDLDVKKDMKPKEKKKQQLKQYSKKNKIIDTADDGFRNEGKN